MNHPKINSLIEFPRFTSQNGSPLLFEAKDKRILLIDDIVGTGKTIKRALAYCNKKNPINIKTSCLFLNRERFNGDNFPDYTVEQTKDWIVFPWEKDYLYGGDKK